MTNKVLMILHDSGGPVEFGDMPVPVYVINNNAIQAFKNEFDRDDTYWLPSTGLWLFDLSDRW